MSCPTSPSLLFVLVLVLELLLELIDLVLQRGGLSLLSHLLKLRRSRLSLARSRGCRLREGLRLLLGGLG